MFERFPRAAPAASVMLLLSLAAPGIASSRSVPEWWDTNLGRDEVVLPGYGPIVLKEARLGLSSGRVMEFAGAFLPAKVASRGVALVKDQALHVQVGGESLRLIPDTVEVLESAPHHVVIESHGTIADAIEVSVITRIEYDGVAMSEVVLHPKKPLTIEKLSFISDVAANEHTTVLGFKARDIRQQKDRRDLLTLPYAGEFVNAVGIADGNRSYWWFADNAEGWIWNGPTVTEVSRDESTVRFTQHLIGAPHTIAEPMTMRFNFLVTPVADMGSEWRAKRVVPGGAAAKLFGPGGGFKLWWTDAFAHDAFPYTQWPEGLSFRVPTRDLSAYPGEARNRQQVESDAQYGVHWIPYFSARALSRLDPALREFASQWEIAPEKEFKEVVAPYTKVYGKRVLTHRAESYTNYLLWRMDDAIERLGIEGIYFDHGPVHDSNNAANGAWIDSNGAVQPSLDILGTRSFLKRLRTLFVNHGRAGYIFVHNSNREIIPAYTFAYAQYTGEQYRSGVVKSEDYLSAVSLDELRARVASDQYGIRTVWLPVEWTYHSNDKTWSGSEQQRRSYRSYESLALLHDAITHPLGAHLTTRTALVDRLDAFGVEKARFVGYWDPRVGAAANDANVKISAYERDEAGATLFVATNLSAAPLRTTIAVDASKYGGAPTALDLAVEKRAMNTRTLAGSLAFELDIPPRDFVWFEIKNRASTPKMTQAAP